MAVVLENTRLSRDFFLMRSAHPNHARMGQFYMVRAWDRYPLLSRPISVFDSDKTSLALLYRLVGEGTRLLSRLRPGDEILLDGPYGNGFPDVTGKTALVGGGVGVAPLYLAALTLRARNVPVHLYLGFSDAAVLEEEYAAVCDRITVDIGGFITNKIDPAGYEQVLACGPDPMMRALHRKCMDAGVPLYVSMENRMACGLGACLVCSCKTVGGNKKVCRDGPVFESKAVYFDA